MAIEIKQLIIKSTLISEHRESVRERRELVGADLKVLKKELVEECRRMVEQSLEEKQER
jgi:hypothetical protein